MYLHIASLCDFYVLYATLDQFADKHVVAFTMMFASVYFRPSKFVTMLADCLHRWTALREVVFVTSVMPYRYEFRHLDDDKKRKIIDFVSKSAALSLRS